MIVLTQAPEINVDLTVSPPNCYDTQTGQISLDAIYGGVSPYTFLLNGRTYNSIEQIGPLPSGSYQLIAQDANLCQQTIDVEIPQAGQIFVDIGDDQIIKLGQAVRIPLYTNLSDSAIAQINWTPDSCHCKEILLSPTEALFVSVTLIDTNGCEVTDRIQITIDRNIKYYIPNVFTPNGDGTNDRFFIQANASIQNINRFVIFNRWGDLIFKQINMTPNIPSLGWDGYYKGQAAEIGVYTYFAELEAIDGYRLVVRGDVTLMR